MRRDAHIFLNLINLTVLVLEEHGYDDERKRDDASSDDGDAALAVVSLVGAVAVVRVAAAHGLASLCLTGVVA